MSAVRSLQENLPLPGTPEPKTPTSDEKKAAAPFAQLLNQPSVRSSKPDHTVNQKEQTDSPKAHDVVEKKTVSKGHLFAEDAKKQPAKTVGLFAQKKATRVDAALKELTASGINQRARQALPEQATTQPAKQEGDVLARLKTDVKAIFNKLPPLHESEPAGKQPVKNAKSSGAPTASAAIDKIRPFRITTQPAETRNLHKKPQSTQEHLNARDQLKGRILDNQHGQVRESVIPLAKMSRAGRSATSGHADAHLIDPEVTRVLRPANSTARRIQKTARKGAHLNPLEDRNYATAPLAEKGIEIKNTQEMLSQLNTDKASEIQHKKSGDTESGGQLGKGGGNDTPALQKGSTKAQSTSQTHNTANWLRALSERTSFMNRTDPHWKVLEMKLDAGDGTMTIKVMKDEDGVSVSVGFSDAGLRAQAESQTSQILENLRAQYDQNVNFSFSNHQESAFNSSMFESAKQHRTAVTPTSVDKPEESAGTNDSLTENYRHVWIG